jgi:hypothetical protein
VGRHEIYYLRSGVARSGKKIAFIFAIFIVNNDDHLAVLDGVNGFFNGI